MFYHIDIMYIRLYVFWKIDSFRNLQNGESRKLIKSIGTNLFWNVKLFVQIENSVQQYSLNRRKVQNWKPIRISTPLNIKYQIWPLIIASTHVYYQISLSISGEQSFFDSIVSTPPLKWKLKLCPSPKSCNSKLSHRCCQSKNGVSFHYQLLRIIFSNQGKDFGYLNSYPSIREISKRLHIFPSLIQPPFSIWIVHLTLHLN